MADPTPAPAGGDDPVVNIHSAAPSQQPETDGGQSDTLSKDPTVLKSIEDDIKRDHLPHIGATG